MKKKLEADLISIAHRVLKLKGKEDTVQLHLEAQKLYEKLSVLRFYEEHINVLKDEISPAILEEKLEQMASAAPATTFEKPLETPVVETPTQEEVIVAEVEEEVIVSEAEATVAVEETPEEEILEESIEAVAEETPQEEVEAEEEPLFSNEELIKEEESEPLFSPIFELSEEEEAEEPVVEATKEPKQISLEDFFTENYKDPEFIKVDDISSEVKAGAEVIFEKSEKVSFTENKIEVTHTETFSKNTESKVTSLNDTLIKGINIGLNDRIAFVKQLFAGSNEDYNRVISQISTMDTLEEAQEFVDTMVKPDYNNWEGKEDYATRFMNLIEKKFL
jgi:hypothetical protein